MMSVWWGDGTNQDLLSGFMLALYLFAQVSLRNLQVLPHLTAILEEGQVAILDPNQLGEGTQQTRMSWQSMLLHASSFSSLSLIALNLNDRMHGTWLYGFTATGNPIQIAFQFGKLWMLHALIQPVWSVVLALDGLFSSVSGFQSLLKYSIIICIICCELHDDFEMRSWEVVEVALN